MREVGRPGVEHAVEEGEQLAGGRGVVHRRADDEPVGGLQRLDGLVHAAAADALARLAAGTAGDTSAALATAGVDEFRLHAALVQHARGLVQGGAGAAVFMGAAVDEKHFHCIVLLLMLPFS